MAAQMGFLFAFVCNEVGAVQMIVAEECYPGRPLAMALAHLARQLAAGPAMRALLRNPAERRTVCMTQSSDYNLVDLLARGIPYDQHTLTAQRVLAESANVKFRDRPTFVVDPLVLERHSRWPRLPLRTLCSLWEVFADPLLRQSTRRRGPVT